MKHPKIAIIGAGPAGISASIQLKRLGYHPQLFEKDIVGGLLWNANLVENYPGFPCGISGPDLIDLMAMQIKNIKIEILNIQITHLFFEDGIFHLHSDEENFVADYVVIASGTKPKPINIKTSDQARCLIHQDVKKILDINGKHIVIIGAGDAAFDHALNLSRKNRISIINHGTNIRSLQLLVDRAFANERIAYLSNTEVETIDLLFGEESKNKHVYRVECNSICEGKFSIECDEVVYAIGRNPQLDFMDQLIETERCIFIGDVRNGIFRQAGIAIGDGIMAAMKIHNQILSRDYNESICRNR